MQPSLERSLVVNALESALNQRHRESGMFHHSDLCYACVKWEASTPVVIISRFGKFNHRFFKKRRTLPFLS